MADGVGTGIGIGIGQGLGEIGDAIRARRDRQRDDREKQADALHAKGVQIASKLLESGYTTRHDAQAGGPILIDAKTGQLAQQAPPEVGNLFNELVSTSKQATALFPPNEPNAIAQHFRKWLKQPQAEAKPNPRAAEFTPEGFTAEAPAPKYTGAAGDFIQLARLATDPSQPEEVRSAAREQLKQGNGWQPTKTPPFVVSPEEAKGRRPGVYRQVEKNGKTATELMPGVPTSAVESPAPEKALKISETGGVDYVQDPKTNKTYMKDDIDDPNTPDDVNKVLKRQVAARKAKDDAEASKIAEQEKRDEKRYEQQAKIQANAFANAYAQKDYAEAESIKKTADTRYNNALALDAFANDALKSHDAAKDKLLAGRLIRESEGRFNPAQYDNLTKNAGLGNTFEQWMNNVESGQLTDTMRQSLVNAAHALLASAKTAKDSLVPPATPGDLKDKAKPKSDVDDIIKDLNNLAPAGKH